MTGIARVSGVFVSSEGRGCRRRAWSDPEQGAGTEFLRQAVQVKNIRVPYGE